MLRVLHILLTPQLNQNFREILFDDLILFMLLFKTVFRELQTL
jgi:hypothetical protein